MPRTPSQQDQVLGALRFKCDLLWAQLDALHFAYVAPGLPPPGAFVPVSSRRGRRSRASPAACGCARTRCAAAGCVLAPERMFVPDETALEVLRLVDGAAQRGRHRRRPRRTLRRPARGDRWRCRRDAGRPRRPRRGERVSALAPPLGLLAELTHRCPLRCPYCSNPLELRAPAAELDTATWARVFREAAALGVLQLHLSGGEPTARRDLVELVAARARRPGSTPTSSPPACRSMPARVDALADAGLDHVQLSVQDTEAAGAERIGGYGRRATRASCEVARRGRARPGCR